MESSEERRVLHHGWAIRAKRIATDDAYLLWKEHELEAYRRMRDRLGEEAFRDRIALAESLASEMDMGHSYNAGLRLMKMVRDEPPTIA